MKFLKYELSDWIFYTKCFYRECSIPHKKVSIKIGLFPWYNESNQYVFDIAANDYSYQHKYYDDIVYRFDSMFAKTGNHKYSIFKLDEIQILKSKIDLFLIRLEKLKAFE
jgi:hypothetical protein